MRFANYYNTFFILILKKKQNTELALRERNITFNNFKSEVTES